MEPSAAQPLRTPSAQPRVLPDAALHAARLRRLPDQVPSLNASSKHVMRFVGADVSAMNHRILRLVPPKRAPSPTRAQSDASSLATPRFYGGNSSAYERRYKRYVDAAFTSETLRRSTPVFSGSDASKHVARLLKLHDRAAVA
ncbi:hypothetical protein FGB62_149g09 [Gracilaria domingensis]|nr:hypothetical protein FGB62_149g09 [Gracilaria domingensis]